MKKYYLFILILFWSYNIQAQKRDNTWILGYYGGEPNPMEDTIFGIQKIKFNNEKPNIIKKIQAKFDIQRANCSISDKEGNLLFFFNGRNLYNKNLELAKGENNINADSVTFLSNMAASQQGIFLPYPADESKTILLSKSERFSKVDGSLRVHAVSFNAAILNNKGIDGLGEVIKRRINIITDTLDLGKVTAVKHANGRDWWVIIQRYYDNTYSKVLIDNQGFRVTDVQKIGVDKSSFYAQNVFTTDGTKYISFENGVDNGSPHLIIFDFDRCSGQLSNPRNIYLGENKYPGGGAAVSPNSMYLYITFDNRVFQYNLKATDIEASQKLIAYYDGFLFLNGYRTNFYLAQLAPDGKIYISTGGASPYLHVINNPDLEGEKCNFVQRGLKLPFVNAWSIPNHPNYRLGALKGSPCDTLKMVATKDVEEEKVEIYPNPAADVLNIQLPENQQYTAIFYDISGRKLKEESIVSQAEIDTSTFPEGMLFCEIRRDNKVIFTKKIVILH